MNVTVNISDHPINRTAVAFYMPGGTIWMSTILLVSVLACITNALIVLIVVKIRELRTCCSFLIAHLSATYFWLSLLSGLNAIHMYGHFIGRPLFPVNFCIIQLFTYTSINGASFYTDALLAINRLLALCQPHYYHKFSRREVTFLGIIFCWIIGIGTHVQYLFGLGGRYDTLSSGQCVVYQTTTLDQMYAQVVTYLPYGIIAASVVIILIKSTTVFLTQDKSGNGGGGRRRYQRRLNRAKMLLVSFISNCLCALPMPVINNFAPNFFRTHPAYAQWLRVPLVVAYLISPILVLALSADYRRGLFLLFNRHRQLRPGNSMSLSSGTHAS